MAVNQSNPAIDPELRLEDFSYDLPRELIAQHPLPERDAARLLVVDRGSGQLAHSTVRELARWLAPGDLLVANNSRVLPARLLGRREDTGGRIELLLLQAEAGNRWSALARPARRLQPGTRLSIMPSRGRDAQPATVCVLTRGEGGLVTISLDNHLRLDLAAYGLLPLPPYITTQLVDEERYQTIYATQLGSAAAPTAGLHFTPALIGSLRAHRIGWAEVTLHVGLDTFRPVTVERVSEHRIHQEWYSIPAETARAVAETKRASRQVVAVGTTVARTLETLGGGWNPDAPTGFSGRTDLFIVPGYRWRLVDALLTNFHLPKSTLLMMVSSLAGTDLMRRVYAEAIAKRYRFYSFGDAMLIR